MFYRCNCKGAIEHGVCEKLTGRDCKISLQQKSNTQVSEKKRLQV